MSKVKFNLVESCMDDCSENDIVFVDEPYWDEFEDGLTLEEEEAYDDVCEEHWENRLSRLAEEQEY